MNRKCQPCGERAARSVGEVHPFGFAGRSGGVNRVATVFAEIGKLNVSADCSRSAS